MEQYKGYTIEKADGFFTEFMAYPTNEGVQHDGDHNGENYVYAGNCKFGTVEDLKDQIDELVPVDPKDKMIKELGGVQFGALEVMSLMKLAQDEGVRFREELYRNPTDATIPKSFIEMMYEFKQNQI